MYRIVRHYWAEYIVKDANLIAYDGWTCAIDGEMAGLPVIGYAESLLGWQRGEVLPADNCQLLPTLAN